MRNIFRSTQHPKGAFTDPVAMAAEAITTQAPNASAEAITAEAIQRELLDSTDALIAEAHALLNAPPPISERAARLQRIGFSGHSEAEAARKYESEMAAAKRKADVARQNAEKYPGLKFIPTENMQAVCKKYGLLLATINRYTGDVPDWALDRIEQCGVKFTRYAFSVLEEKAKTPGLLPLHQHRVIGISEQGMNMVRGWSGNDRFCRVETDNKELAESLVSDNGHIHAYSTLMIAAPAKEIKLYYGEAAEPGVIFQVKDPIVCITVDDGYMVVCAWGEEGQDPQVFNTANN